MATKSTSNKELSEGGFVQLHTYSCLNKGIKAHYHLTIFCGSNYDYSTVAEIDYIMCRPRKASNLQEAGVTMRCEGK